MKSRLKELQNEKKRLDKDYRQKAKAIFAKYNHLEAGNIALDMKERMRKDEHDEYLNEAIEFAIVHDYEMKLGKFNSYISKDEKYWIESKYGSPYLSDVGKEYCSNMLRQLQKEKLDIFGQIATPLTAILGLIVAILALVLK